MAECDDIEHWDAQGLENVIGTMDGIHKSHVKLGDTLDGVQANLESWGGLTAEAWHRYHNKVRVDVDDQGHQAKAVADKLRPLYDEVLGIKARYRYLKATIIGNGSYDSSGDLVHWKLNNDGSINTGGIPLGDMQSVAAKQQLEDQMKALLHKADGVDAEIADALRAITTPGGAVADGPHVGQPAPQPEHKPEDKPRADDATIAAGALTPGDQLPLAPKDGNVAVPTEASARHTGQDKGSDYLKPGARPSPLIAGLGADEWRKRLGSFNPGDPLPDPRTPTGDKAIDTIAHAAGQQNSTYAWGGNKSLTGPSAGIGDDGGSADKFEDIKRKGYDCGGLVRYSLSESFAQNSPPNTPHDGFVRSDGANAGAGTDRLDKSSILHPVTDGGGKIPSSTVAGVARPGDVLVFQDMERPHEAFDGKNTQHTGIYVGNGYMINAPQSGESVGIANAAKDGRNIDVLRIDP